MRMMKLVCIFVGFGCLVYAPIFGQRIIKDSTDSCSLRMADLSVVGKLRLGSRYSEIEEVYPDLEPIPGGSSIYSTKSPYAEFSHIMFHFSPNRTLISYSIIYADK